MALSLLSTPQIQDSISRRFRFSFLDVILPVPIDSHKINDKFEPISDLIVIDENEKEKIDHSKPKSAIYKYVSEIVFNLNQHTMKRGPKMQFTVVLIFHMALCALFECMCVYRCCTETTFSE